MEKNFDEITEIKDGKDIILQNLETSRVEKNLKFIENEVNRKIIDLRSNQYLKYKVYNQSNKITFKTLKKSDLKKQLLEYHHKPSWLSETEYKKLEDETISFDKKNELIDHIIQRYDAFMDKNYTKFIRFDEKQREFRNDKRQHVLFRISVLVTGKLNSGDEIRTPLLLEKIRLVIDHNLRQVTIKSMPKKEYLINHIFLTWLANKKNYPIENELEKIAYLNDFSEIRESNLLKSYEKLGIPLNIENIENIENLSYSQINLRKENTSSKKDLETASHEVKHLLIANHHGAFIPYVEINNTNSKYGTTLIEESNNDKLTLKDNLAIVIAPLSKKEIELVLDFSINKPYGSDAYFASEILNEITEDENEKYFIIHQIFDQNNQIFNSPEFLKKHDLFIKYLLKHKSMDADEIVAQLNNESLIDSYFQEVNEQKIERNTFFIEKVDAIALFTNLENDKIYTDTKYIFKETNFIENLLGMDSSTILNNSSNKINSKNNLTFEEDFLNNSKNNSLVDAEDDWGFKEDVLQNNSNIFSSNNNSKSIYVQNKSKSIIDCSLSNSPDFIPIKDINWGFSADIHQQEAIKKALNEKRVIIQGPPGTGKTQIILNIITNNIFHNKKTLIISEKITAVDVINRKISIDKYLSKFIMDLYNLDEKRIGFYNELSKILTIYNKNFKDYDEELLKSNYFNDKEKEKLEIINNKIIKINSFLLDNKINLDEYFQIIENTPTLVEKDLVKDIPINNFKLLDQFDVKEYNKFKIWNDQRLFLKNLTNFFNYPINKTIINKILKIYNRFSNYNELNKLNCLFILLEDQTILNKLIKPFIKIKLANLSKANKLKSAELFLEKFFLIKDLDNNVSNFKKFLKFNNNKYKDEKLEKLEKLYQLLQTNISLDRLKQIEQYFLFANNLKLIKEDFSENNFFNFPLLNDEEKLKLGRYRSAAAYKHIINNKLDTNLPLRREIEKIKNRKKLTKNIKDFIYKNWNELKVLFPVVLATPENVSNHIPLEYAMFDTLIIDEASQMFLERAFPAIFRSKQIIIIGDKNQLRPLRIGERANTNTANDHIFKYQELVENESILDLFNFIIKGKNNLMLKTHYRSHFENLIRFSNENFYEKSLKFIEQNIDDLKASNSIQIINVKDGIWKNQTNEKEADEIIKLINAFFVKDQILSMGIILFSKKQAGLVKKKLFSDGNSRANKSFDQSNENSLFIKSIDQVQGEERDVIVFGITYGKNAHNYGLLSREYGENRINVATTRAKRKIFLVKSHNANEYPLSETYASRGPQTLINFIKFCEEFTKINKYLNNDNDFLSTNNNVYNVKLIMHQIKEKQSNYQNYHLEIQNLLEKYLIKFENHDCNNLELKKSLDFWFYFEKTNNFAYYLVDNNLLKNPQEELWFYNQLLKVRGYIPKPIYFTKLIEFIENDFLAM